MSPFKVKRRIMLRTFIDPLEKNAAVDHFGKCILEMAMAQCGYSMLGTEFSKELDSAGIDYLYGKEFMRSDVQLKSASTKGSKWRWNIIDKRKGEGISREFYGEKGNFLFLVCFNLERLDGGFSAPSTVQVGLIPALKVLEFFERASATERQIRISKNALANGTSKNWSKYFGLVNIRKTLAKEFKRQSRVREWVKRMPGDFMVKRARRQKALTQ